jgi:FAD:protein FMN transferase
MTNSRLLSASAALVLSFSAFRKPASELFEAVEPHMGTLFRIKLYAEDREQAQHAFQVAFARVDQLDGILSDYKPDSELNSLRRNAAGHPVRVSHDLFRVILASQELAEKTDGAFDITVGPLTHLWRSARKQQRLPEASALEEAKKKCGFRNLRLDTSAHTVELLHSGMELDVGGIAKGYAADQVLTLLASLGIQSALVAASGDLTFSAAPPSERGWTIGIDSFDEADRPFTRVLFLSNAAVSTSGNHEQHLDAAGTRYSHILDPRTGVGLTADVTVTVVAQHGMDADGMATALSVLVARHGLDSIRQRPDISALVVTRNQDSIQVFESPSFHLLPGPSH